MKLLKSHPILSIANSFVIDSPSPSNLSYLWNYGSLLGLCLVIQIITGVTLAMHYSPTVDFAFLSVEHITLLHTLFLLGGLGSLRIFLTRAAALFSLCNFRSIKARTSSSSIKARTSSSSINLSLVFSNGL